MGRKSIRWGDSDPPLMFFFINFNSPRGRSGKKTTKNDLSWAPCNCLIFSITLDKWMSGGLFRCNVSWQRGYSAAMCHVGWVIPLQCVMSGGLFRCYVSWQRGYSAAMCHVGWVIPLQCVMSGGLFRCKMSCQMGNSSAMCHVKWVIPVQDVISEW
jgi:hypothetical protein